MQDSEKADLIIGRQAVTEALRAGRTIDSVLIARGERGGSLGKIIADCKEKGIVVKDADKKKLDFLCGHQNHQGIVAFTAVKEYSSLEDIFDLAKSRGEAPFIIICDELEDPHNLGAIIRTAEAAGAHGVLVPKRRSASLSYAVGKASAGAVEYMPVARVTNLAAAIDDLKSKGLWIYGADMGGMVWSEYDYTGACALVIGSEGKGLSRLVREKCDFIVSLPMKGKINSLNASVAAGILMFEVAGQRSGLFRPPAPNF
ncbi:MAG TPA: 23S rRNA (guanosine(2251)-2'-O)-methyltransferase RlmB [Clostridiales bacterium]|nr:23S rRNA (guanosine(2251)-2'-O)-methyltransferase RlmB [Clostridiales bacterium]